MGLHDNYRGGVRSMSRRRFLAGAAAALGGMALSGCSGGGIGSNEQVLRFWNLFGGGDGARLDEMMSDFRQNSPVDLRATTLSWGAPYYTKLSMAAVGGRPPDVGVLHLSRMPAYAPAGLLEPLDPAMLSEYGIGPDRFLPEVLERAKYEGEIYAIPLDTHPFVMFYNTDVCKEAGLLDGDGNLKAIQGPDAVIEAFKKAQEVTGGQGVSFDVVGAASTWRLFSSLYGQLGGEVLSPDASEVVLDEGKAEQAIEFMRELTLGAGVVPSNQDYAAAVAQFQNGNAGFHLNGEWEVTTFLLAELPFSMTQFPDVYGSRRAFADNHSFVIPTGIADDARSMDAALKFTSSMLKNSLIWARGGHIPSYLPVAESEEYRNLKPQSNYVKAAEAIVPHPEAWFSGSGSDLENQVGASLIAAMSGAIDTRGAIGQILTRLRELVNTPNPVPV
jgi:multiple sugar transport system substrate-binding protein